MRVKRVSAMVGDGAIKRSSALKISFCRIYATGTCIMAAWNMSEVILAEGLAEVGAEDPPASDLRFVNTYYDDLYMEEEKTLQQLVQVQ